MICILLSFVVSMAEVDYGIKNTFKILDTAVTMTMNTAIIITITSNTFLL